MNDSNKPQRLFFIGAGNMARSLIGGLIDKGYPAGAITATDINEGARQAIQADFGIHSTQDCQRATRAADILILAVKPQTIPAVCATLHDTVQSSSPLVISIAAGIRAFDINRWLGGGAAIVRCMPNTPALIQCGASGLYANQATSDVQREHAQHIIQAVSQVVWVDDENKIDAVTAVSGSGPAYFFLIIEAMQAAAKTLGLNVEQANMLVLQTAYGATKMAKMSTLDIGTLRENVTSKGGTTAAALEVFKDNALGDVFLRAMQAAAARSTELGKQFGEN